MGKSDDDVERLSNMVTVTLTGVGMAGTVLALSFHFGERLAGIEFKIKRLEQEMSFVIGKKTNDE